MLLLLLLEAALFAAEPRVEVQSRATAPGEAVLIAVKGGTGTPRGRLAGSDLNFEPGRSGSYFALSAFDLEAATGSVRLELEIPTADGPHLWSSELSVEAKEFPRQELTVEDKYVALAPADEARADREAARLKAVFAEVSKPLRARRFASPIPGAVSGRFGERRVFNGVPKSPHSGADLKAKAGAPVKAPADGRVALVGALFYSGKTVVLDHGLGLYTVYAHLSRVDVKPGQLVKAGRRLGAVGATGRVTGPHLHWGARLRGARVDPFSLVALPLADAF